MKNTEIIKALKANKNVNDFEIINTEKNSRELFYVLDNLQLNRATKTNKTQVIIYVDVKDKRGSSTVVLNSCDNISSFKKKINDAVVKAKSGLNNFYPLEKKTKNIVFNNDVKGNLNTIALNIGKAVFEANIYDNGWINSTEIFVSRIKKTFVNSNGIKHSSTNLSVEVEVIPTWTNKKEEFELYKWFEQSQPDYSKITREVDEILSLAQARSCAKKIKDVKIPKNIRVLVQNDMLDLLAWNFAADVSYKMKYYNINHYQKGSTISKNKLNITLKGVEEGCVNSCPFDNHGVVLKNREIVKNGKVVDNWGDIKHSYYFKSKASGDYNVLCLNGKQCNYKKEKHLIVTNFSSPQLDENTGYWGGEVRLALYFDGKKYIPVSNFSIAGNIYKDINSLEVSKEEVFMPDYHGPKYLIFKGINIF